MKNIIFSAALFSAVMFTGHAEAATVTGYLSGETVSGMTKTCFYDTIRGQMAFSTGATALCPLSKTFYI